MMISIVLYNRVKNEKIIRAMLERSAKNKIFQHLIPYNPGLRLFRKNLYVSFEIL